MINSLMIQAMEWMEAYFIDGMCILLAVLALQWFIRFNIVSLGSIRRSFSRINRKLSGMNAYGPDNLKKVQLLFTYNVHKALRNAWTSYQYAYNLKTAGAARPDVREYFNVEEMVTVPAARRKSEAVPGILTVIGALGSFIHVIAILGREGITAGPDRLVETLLASSTILVVAVLLSVVYQLGDRSLYQGALRKLHAFTGFIDQKLPMPALVAEKEEIGKKKLTEPVEQMIELFVQKLDKAMYAQYEPMTQKAKELLAFQEESQKALAGVTAGMVESGEKQQKINISMQTVMDSLTGYSEKMVASQEQISLSLDKTESFVQMLTSVLEANKEVSENLSKQREALLQDSREYFEKTSQHSKKISDDLSYQIEALFARFTEVTTMTLEKLDTSMNQPLDKLTLHMDEMMRNMEEQVRGINLYSKELNMEITELNKSLKESVKEFSGQLDAGVKDTLGTFDKGLGEVTDRFGVIMGDIKDTADELSVAAAGAIKEKSSKARGHE